MTLQEVMTAITTVGFPIVMCLACAWYIKYTNDKQREEVNRLNDQHAAEMNAVTQAINNNTIAITRLTERLDAQYGK